MITSHAWGYKVTRGEVTPHLWSRDKNCNQHLAVLKLWTKSFSKFVLIVTSITYLDDLCRELWIRVNRHCAVNYIHKLHKLLPLSLLYRFEEAMNDDDCSILFPSGFNHKLARLFCFRIKNTFYYNIMRSDRLLRDCSSLLHLCT